MNLSKVKLVVSDMDGTLLNSKNEVSQQFFDLFKELQKHNVLFCAASGRQHNSIVEKLASIKDDIYVIAENGAISKKGEDILLLNSLESEKIIKIIPLLRNIKRANMVLCSSDIDSVIPVLIGPGQMAFTVIFSLPSSTASARVRPVKPDLAAA